MESIEAAANTRAVRRSSGRALDTINATGQLTVEMKLKYAAPMDLSRRRCTAPGSSAPTALTAAAADRQVLRAGIDGGTGPYTIESYTRRQPGRCFGPTRLLGRLDSEPHYQDVVIQIMPEAIVQQQTLTAARSTSHSRCRSRTSRSSTRRQGLHARPSRRSSTTSASSTRRGAARRPQGPPGAVVRDPVRRHHHGRRAGLRHAVPWPRAGGRLPVPRPDAPVHAGPRQGKDAADGGGHPAAASR